MFEWLTRVKLYETIDLNKKNRLEELLRIHSIEFTLEIEDLHHRNAFDAADLGHVFAKPKDVYVFWINKKDKPIAYKLLKEI